MDREWGYTLAASGYFSRNTLFGSRHFFQALPAHGHTGHGEGDQQHNYKEKI
jgi:hypothetical protein